MLKKIYTLYYITKRFFNALKTRPWLHLFSFITLALAFFSFVTAFVLASNIDATINKWLGSAEFIVILDDSADTDEIEKFAKAVMQLKGVKDVKIITRDIAKEDFEKTMGSMAVSIEKEAFPASLNVYLNYETAHNFEVRKKLAKRISKVSMVDKVNLYDSWVGRILALRTTGRIITWVLGLIALLVSVFVTGAVARAQISSRKKEIEILKLLGASSFYIKTPFIFEGCIQSLSAMILAVGALFILLDKAYYSFGDILSFAGFDTILSPSGASLIAFLTASMLCGIAGSYLFLFDREKI